MLTAKLNSQLNSQIDGPPGRCLLSSCVLFSLQVNALHLHCQDVSVHVPPVLHGAGGGLPLHQGVLLGAAGDQGVRRDRFLADAPRWGGAHSSPVGQGCEPGDGRTPTPALAERPAVDGAILHRGAGKRQRHRRGTGK